MNLPSPDGYRRLRRRLVSLSERIATSMLEGINSRIKVIKRMACGYRDDAFFFLKIRAAFPGLPR
jgi:transposase